MGHTIHQKYIECMGQTIHQKYMGSKQMYFQCMAINDHTPEVHRQ